MPARLAVVVDTFPRWSERFIARECRELLRRGADLTLFALRRGALPFGADPEFEPLLPRLRVLPTSLSAAMTGLTGLLRKRRTEALIAVREELGLAGVARTARAMQLAAWLREGQFTHIHAHFANWPSTLAWLAACEAGVPFTFSVHARDLFLEVQLLGEKARDALAIFACHARARERLAEIPSAKSRAVLMYHGLPLEDFPFREPDGSHGPSQMASGELLVAGRFVAKKGLSDLLAALDTPALKARPLRVAFVGDGPERAALERRIAKRGLADRARIVPPESARALRERLLAAALLVVPYREAPDGDRDGLPNVVLEAFALGVPVVGTDAGGLPEILRPETGYVARAGDPESLAREISACLDDPASAARKVRAARRHAEAHHDIRRTIEPLWKLLG
jgi:glycosyltransferase involved in cell wall biosynthesis